MKLRTFVIGIGLSVLSIGFASAQALIASHKIPITLAVEASQAAIDACKKMGWDVTVTVVDAGGLTKAILVGDGAGPPALEISRRKAYTAAMYFESTETRVNNALAAARRRAAENTPTIQTTQSPTDPNIVQMAGGEPIKVGNEVIGAIGVSGAGAAGIDPACARAGIEKIKDRLK